MSQSDVNNADPWGLPDAEPDDEATPVASPDGDRSEAEDEAEEQTPSEPVANAGTTAGNALTSLQGTSPTPPMASPARSPAAEEVPAAHPASTPAAESPPPADTPVSPPADTPPVGVEPVEATQAETSSEGEAQPPHPETSPVSEPPEAPDQAGRRAPFSQMLAAAQSFFDEPAPAPGSPPQAHAGSGDDKEPGEDVESVEDIDAASLPGAEPVPEDLTPPPVAGWTGDVEPPVEAADDVSPEPAPETELPAEPPSWLEERVLGPAETEPSEIELVEVPSFDSAPQGDDAPGKFIELEEAPEEDLESLVAELAEEAGSVAPGPGEVAEPAAEVAPSPFDAPEESPPEEPDQPVGVPLEFDAETTPSVYRELEDLAETPTPAGPERDLSQTGGFDLGTATPPELSPQTPAGAAGEFDAAAGEVVEAPAAEPEPVAEEEDFATVSWFEEPSPESPPAIGEPSLGKEPAPEPEPQVPELAPEPESQVPELAAEPQVPELAPEPEPQVPEFAPEPQAPELASQEVPEQPFPEWVEEARFAESGAVEKAPEMPPGFEEPAVHAAAPAQPESAPEAAEPSFQSAAAEREVSPPEEPAEVAPVIAGAGVEWGSRWKESAQGWVESEAGRSTWRPIVSTSPNLSEWQVDTYLGIVTGDVTVPGDVSGQSLEQRLAQARAAAARRMLDEALARGAHAVIAVHVGYHELGNDLLVSAAGTAVTLKTNE